MPDCPDYAPGYSPEAEGAPWWRRSIAQGIGYMLPPTFFLAVPVIGSFETSPEHTPLLTVASVALAVVFLGSTLIMKWPEWARWLWIAGVVLVVLAISAYYPPAKPTYYSVFVTAMAAILLPWLPASILIVAASVLGGGVALAQGDFIGVSIAAVALAVGLSLSLGTEVGRARDRLAVSEQRTAVLAVAAERERIGRDLHDILGHSLTSIAITADLADRLIGRDDAAARREVASIASIARQSLADVRATASGMRHVRLASEIASARSVLEAAGIEAETPTALPDLDDAPSELLGFAVREAVTNVVRHSRARTCTIAIVEGGIRVTDDGVGIDPEATVNGSGLGGLQTRLAERGGRLDVAAGGPGTVVTATLREAHP